MIEHSIERIKAIKERCSSKIAEHYRGWNEADTREESDFHWDLYRLYKTFEQRCYTLAYSLRNPKKFGDVPSWKYLEYPEYIVRQRAIKAERKAKFESSYRVHVWFLQSFLSADYGSFCCDKCFSPFYHSPSTIWLGKVKKVDCACGYCVNKLTQQEIFS